MNTCSYIYNEAEKVTISGGRGKDTLDNTGNNSRIDEGDDMDSIKNSGANIDINSGYGKDRIINLASNVTLEGGDEDDTIFNSGNNVSINAGEGNNSVSIDSSAGGYQTVVAGDGQNTIEVGERDETEEKRYHNRITVGDGNNFINNSNVELSTISAGNSNDTIITGGGEGTWYFNSDVSILQSLQVRAITESLLIAGFTVAHSTRAWATTSFLLRAAAATIKFQSAVAMIRLSLIFGIRQSTSARAKIL